MATQPDDGGGSGLRAGQVNEPIPTQLRFAMIEVTAICKRTYIIARKGHCGQTEKLFNLCLEN